MSLLEDKISKFTLVELDLFMESLEGMDHMYKPSSMKRMYQNWLRNDNEARDFDVVLMEKYSTHLKKLKKKAKNFKSLQVGYVEIDWSGPSYKVSLIGQQPYKTSFINTNLASYDELVNDSLERLCKTNSLELKESRQPNTLILVTVFSPS